MQFYFDGLNFCHNCNTLLKMCKSTFLWCLKTSWMKPGWLRGYKSDNIKTITYISRKTYTCANPKHDVGEMNPNLTARKALSVQNFVSVAVASCKNVFLITRIRVMLGSPENLFLKTVVKLLFSKHRNFECLDYKIKIFLWQTLKIFANVWHYKKI